MIGMGLDMTIYRARTKEAFKQDNWYGSESVTEVYYSRKFWDLLNSLSFVSVNDDCGEYIRLSYENIEEMLQFSIHNCDYFDGFKTVESLCEILNKFEDDDENGWHYYLEFSY